MPLASIQDKMNHAVTGRNEQVRFLFTKDIWYVQKFIELREQLYATDPKFIGFREFKTNELQDYIHPQHYTQLLMIGDRCIGGGRVSHAPPDAIHLLPLELDLCEDMVACPFRLKHLLKELELDKKGAVEVSRMLVAPEYRDDLGLIATMFKNFYLLGLSLNAEYLFAMTDKVRSRMYRRIAHATINRTGVVFSQLDLPDKPYFEGKKMQIIGWDKDDKLKDLYPKLVL